MLFCALVRQPIEVAAKRVGRRSRPAGGQQRDRQLRVMQRYPTVSVDQQRSHDEAVFGIRIGMVAKRSNHRVEAAVEGVILACEAIDIPAVANETS